MIKASMRFLSRVAHKFNRDGLQVSEKKQKRKWLRCIDILFLMVMFGIGASTIIYSQAKHAPAVTSTKITTASSDRTAGIATGQSSVPPGKGGFTPDPNDPCPYGPGFGSCATTTDNPSNNPYECPSGQHHFGGITNECVGNPQGDCTGNVTNDWLDDPSTGALFRTDSGLTYKSDAVTTILPLMQSVAGTFFVLVIALAGAAIALRSIGLNYADALESIPRVLFAVIVSIVVAYFISQIIDIENFLCTMIVGVADSAGLTAIVMPSNCWQPAVNAFSLTVFNYFLDQAISQIPIVGLFGAGLQVADVIEFIRELHFFIMALLSMILGIQLVTRLVLIVFYIVLAPLAISCMGLPGNMGQGVAQGWFKGFLSLVFSQFFQVMCLAIGTLILKQAPGGGMPQVSAPIVDNNLFANLAPMGIAWLILRIPSIMGSSAVSLTMNAGQTFGGAAITMAGASMIMAREAGQTVGAATGQAAETGMLFIK